MRSQARETVFKYIFSRLFNSDDEGLFDVLSSALNQDDKIFATNLLGYIDKNIESYFNAIENLSVGYKLNRILNADKCAILIGMAEFDSFKETPVAVVIDEAVKLAAKYSTENSTDFVNGILAEYVRRNNG